ncbi:prolactin-7D1-like [Acomys russatus]|uniref:prolactin-7D1-like n=1 Tax=Acomys russatus TaxID=60746 RepID=UPI0021E2CA2C|nr:prolactin-7D1-like [Acomys russatus]
MPLSLIQPCSSRTFLMLFVSKLLLWEMVDSAPMNVSEAALSDDTLRILFDNATVLSNNLSDAALDLRSKLFTNSFSSALFMRIRKNLSKNEKIMATFSNNCHTAPISVPETREEVIKTSFEDFLKIILNTLLAWKDPLKHLVTELSAMPKVPDAILSTAKATEALNKNLLEHIMMIISKVNPAIEENGDYPVWSALDSLRSDNEETRFYALYTFSYCLNMDLQILNFHVNLLRCLLVHSNLCYNSES